MASMNVSLPGQMKDWVEAQTRGGRYANASDYIRDLIRRDQERQGGVVTPAPRTAAPAAPAQTPLPPVEQDPVPVPSRLPAEDGFPDTSLGARLRRARVLAGRAPERSPSR